MPTLNQAGIDLIKRNEGCKLTAYQDVVGVWTIGYGHTGPEVADGLEWTQEQADQALLDDLKKFELGVGNAIADNPTTDDQYSAMVSLAYNIGLGNFNKTSVLRLHNQKRYAMAADAFLLWDKAGGKVFPGLLRRRKEERALYLT